MFQGVSEQAPAPTRAPAPAAPLPAVVLDPPAERPITPLVALPEAPRGPPEPPASLTLPEAPIDPVAAAMLERRHLAVTISHLVTRLLEQGLDAQADRAMQLLAELRSAPPPTVRTRADDEEGTGS